jgi:hypothetical protein
MRGLCLVLLLFSFQSLASVTADNGGVTIPRVTVDEDAWQSQGLAADNHRHGAECSVPAGNSTKPRIGLGFTTAKRPMLFIRTYLTFRCVLPGVPQAR